jgi:RHS repeat-associated protein
MRIWSQKGSAAKVYEFHSRDNRLLMDWQASSGLPGFTKEHIYAGQRRIAEVHTVSGQAAKVTHAHPDPSGSPAMLSDASGLVSAREHYRPYGDKLISPNTNESAGFANKAFDASTNLSYTSARYYNPTLGRFISPDPVHFVEDNVHSFNRYAYANNNPMKFVDPTGEFAEAGIEALSITTGIKSAVDNFKDGKLGAMAVDIVGVFADIVGLAIPGAPGVAGLGIQASRQAAKAAEKAGNKAAATAVELTDEQAKNVARFQGKIPANAKQSLTVGPLPNGGVVVQATSPGKVPGSSAVYEKQIDAAGQTIGVSKTTYDPAGSIVHVKVK